MFRSHRTHATKWHMLPQYFFNHDDVILLMISTKSVTLGRFSEKLPDDGHRRPKHVGAIV
jgi:hypothetical protein